MNISKLKTFLFEKVSASNLPGLSIAAVRGDEMIWSHALGFRDVARGLPATPATLYGIGSVTKSFTAIAIMQLAEQGRLDLNDPVEKHLPAFRIKPFGETVRLWHFLSHSSGIPALGFSESRFREALGSAGVWLPVESHAAILHFMHDADDWAAARPGERWFYMNEGYMLLGAVIERLSGMTYNRYIQANILEPLGMTHSLFEYEDFEQVEDRATPYIIGPQRESAGYVFNPVNAKGGLMSNVLDLARYVRMFLRGGSLEGVRMVSAKSIQEMQTERVSTAARRNPLGEISYGYGLGITHNFLGHRLVGHAGSTAVSTAYMGFIPEQDIGVALLSNGSGYSTTQMGQYALALMLGSDPVDLPFVQREKLFQKLAGDYASYRGTIKARVRPAGDYLMLEMFEDKFSSPPVPLAPQDLAGPRYVFNSLSGGSVLTGEFVEEDGQITLLYERYAFRRQGGAPQA